MATAPIAAPQDPSAAPDDSQSDGSEDQSGGFTVEIAFDATGKPTKFAIEPAAEESDEESAGDSGDASEGEADNSQPVKNLQQVIQLLKDAARNGGQVSNASNAQSQMMEGYGAPEGAQ